MWFGPRRMRAKVRCLPPNADFRRAGPFGLVRVSLLVHRHLPWTTSNGAVTRVRQLFEHGNENEFEAESDRDVTVRQRSQRDEFNSS